MTNQNFVKLVTPVRTMRSDIGMVKISLYNDQVQLNVQPATQQKTEYGGIKYNGNPSVAPNVRFSVGVAAGIAALLRTCVIPAADDPTANKKWDVFASKRGQYESYLTFEVREGKIRMTGTEIYGGQKKSASYMFPATIITDGEGKNTNIHGEALALAELFSEIGGENEMPEHLKQYNQAVKDNMANGRGFGGDSGNQPASPGPAQSVDSWSPF